MFYVLIEFKIMGDTTTKTVRSCALCGSPLQLESGISICSECIKVADCCNGLENL
jgi:hypothetical protein